MLATIISVFVQLKLSSQVESYSKYPMMYSSRTTNIFEYHGPVTSSVFLKGQAIPYCAGSKGNFLLLSKSIGGVGLEPELPMRSRRQILQAHLWKRIRKGS